MAAYSLDLRKRVLRAWDSGMKPEVIGKILRGNAMRVLAEVP